MRALFLAVAVVLVLPVHPGKTAEDRAVEVARRLAPALGFENRFDDMFYEISCPKDQLKAEFVLRTRIVYRPKFEQLIETNLQVWAEALRESFTALEIQDILDFLNSPVGKKLVTYMAEEGSSNFYEVGAGRFSQLLAVDEIGHYTNFVESPTGKRLIGEGLRKGDKILLERAIMPFIDFYVPDMEERGLISCGRGEGTKPSAARRSRSSPITAAEERTATEVARLLLPGFIFVKRLDAWFVGSTCNSKTKADFILRSRSVYQPRFIQLLSEKLPLWADYMGQTFTQEDLSQTYQFLISPAGSKFRSYLVESEFLPFDNIDFEKTLQDTELQHFRNFEQSSAGKRLKEDGLEQGYFILMEHAVAPFLEFLVSDMKQHRFDGCPPPVEEYGTI